MAHTTIPCRSFIELRLIVFHILQKNIYSFGGVLSGLVSLIYIAYKRFILE